MESTLRKRIFLLGLSKTGTSVLAYKIHDALSEPKAIHFEVSRFGQEIGESILDHLPLMTEDINMITKCLVHPRHVKDFATIFECASLYTHHVWIARDPRDRLISELLYSFYSGHRPEDPAKGKKFDENYQRVLHKVREKEKAPRAVSMASLHAHLDPRSYAGIQYMTYLNLNDLLRRMEGKWHFVRYEDLVDGKLEALEDYLGLDLKAATEVASHRNRVKRSAKYGNWREWFTEEDVRTLKPIFNPYLKRFGYDTEDWELHPPEELPSVLGSEYLTRMHHLEPSMAPPS